MSIVYTMWLELAAHSPSQKRNNTEGFFLYDPDVDRYRSSSYDDRSRMNQTLVLQFRSG